MLEGGVAMRKYILLVMAAVLAGCSPNLDGEYIATKKVLFFTLNASLTIQGDSAVLSVDNPGSDKPAKDAFQIKRGDGQIALFKPETPDDQLIFNIQEDGKKLVYQNTGAGDLPEVWIRKVKI